MNIDIKRIAKLSRLKIDESEIARYEKEMSDIIDMVEQLPAIEDDLLLDTSNVMKLRKDELSNNKISRDEILKNAPKVVAGCVVVPKTVD